MGFSLVEAFSERSRMVRALSWVKQTISLRILTHLAQTKFFYKLFCHETINQNAIIAVLDKNHIGTNYYDRLQLSIIV